MDANVIDTLRFADRLKDVGFDPPKAHGLARALGEELGEVVLTRIDHDSLGLRIDGLDAKFDAKFQAMEAKFGGLEARFGGLEARFEGVEARFEGVEARFVGLDAKFESLHSNLKLLMAVFAIGFSLVIGLGIYNVVAS